jgi:hypothetical protein
MDYKIKDEGLHESGLKSIKWAEAHMPVLKTIRKDFEKNKPLADLKIGDERNSSVDQYSNRWRSRSFFMWVKSTFNTG